MTEVSNWVIDATTATFETEVLARSQEMLVVVDFWAEWCGPCKQLAPVLEALAREFHGKFLLAKVNVDAEPQLAAAFRVQSIPFVVAVKDGQLVDHFQGALPESQLRQWLERLLPSPADELIQKGQSLEASDPAAAEIAYREAQELDPDNDEIRVRLARVILAQDRDDEARRIIEQLEARGFLEPEAETIKSQLDLRDAAADSGGLEEARRAAQTEPDNLTLQLRLADALAVARKHEEALQICLNVLERDKHGAGGEAKETMLKIFDVLGPGSDLTGKYRRQLATLLY